MSQKEKLLHLFKKKQSVSYTDAKQRGVKNLRQQVYFLGQGGHQIINVDKQEYRLLR